MYFKSSKQISWPRVCFSVNTLRLGQHGWHFANNTFRCIFLIKNVCTLIETDVSLKLVPKGLGKGLVPSDTKPLPEPVLPYCQWVIFGPVFRASSGDDIYAYLSNQHAPDQATAVKPPGMSKMFKMLLPTVKQNLWCVMSRQDVVWGQFNGLMQKRHNSSALAMELCPFCVKPSNHIITLILVPKDPPIIRPTVTKPQLPPTKKNPPALVKSQPLSSTTSGVPSTSSGSCSLYDVLKRSQSVTTEGGDSQSSQGSIKSSSTVSSLPDPDFTLPPGMFEIILIVDKSEQFSRYVANPCSNP